MLTKGVADYVALRRAGGFKYFCQEGLLRSFARFASARGDHWVRTDTAIAWASLAPSTTQQESRLRTVIAFARHCRAEDAAHELPVPGVFGSGRHRRPVAHVYSDAEIAKLLSAALALGPKASLRPRTYYTLFGLLASTGLRIGEAVRLRFEHVTTDGLLIKETKFKKSRVVPLHPTTTAALQRYVDLRSEFGGPDPHVFVTLGGHPMSAADAQITFREVVRVAGLTAARRGRYPRLHDFRHTWAVRALESSPTETGQVDRHARTVSTYLGHSSVASSYWYMHATPLVMRAIADACAETKGGLP